MTINRVTLAEALRAIGKAFVYAGDPTTAGGLIALGATEGDIEVEELESYNDFTVPEHTGGAVHERKVIQEGAIVTVPLVIGPKIDATDDGSSIYDKISSLGDGSGGGHSEQQDGVTTSLLVIPQSEVPAGGLATEDTTADTVHDAWVGGNIPIHAVWLWRAIAEVGSMSFRHGDGGKIIREVSFRTLFDASKPEGHKLWTRGNPYAHGITVEI